MKAYCVSRIVARLLFIVVSMGLLSQVNTVYSANKINPGQYKKIVFGCYTTDINDFPVIKILLTPLPVNILAGLL